MTRKRSTDPIEEFGEPIEQETIEPRFFDFTGPAEALDDESKSVYYRLRRAAILAGDESKLPDGQVYTKAAVIEILGEDYANSGSDPKCCG